VRYSSAARCGFCDQRAILDRTTAEHLAAASGGRLLSFECPVGNGVHVINPVFEHGRSTSR